MSSASNSSRLIYPARRAVEHAATVPGLRPRRLFALLWPLRQVETAADVVDEQPYEFLERFVVLAILDGGLTRSAALASFLGIPESLVNRCLNLLSVIGHVQRDGDSTQLTELGVRSARDQIRYVPTESRQDLLIEAFTSTPLPQRYYDRTVPVLQSHTVDASRLADRTRFTALFQATPFAAEVVRRLAERPDRAAYNLPESLRNLRIVRMWNAFLPVYLIETADDNLLAYSAAGTPHDAFLENICRQAPQMRSMIENESLGNPQQIWTDWLAEGRRGPGTLQQLPNGLWRATFRATAFGPQASLPLSQVGSFHFRSRHFIQVWCNEEKTRRVALLNRLLGILQLPDIATKDDLLRHAAPLSELLDVPAVSFSDLRHYAEREGAHKSLVRLDSLD